MYLVFTKAKSTLRVAELPEKCCISFQKPKSPKLLFFSSLKETCRGFLRRVKLEGVLQAATIERPLTCCEEEVFHNQHHLSPTPSLSCCHPGV